MQFSSGRGHMTSDKNKAVENTDFQKNDCNYFSEANTPYRIAFLERATHLLTSHGSTDKTVVHGNSSNDLQSKIRWSVDKLKSVAGKLNSVAENITNATDKIKNISEHINHYSAVKKNSKTTYCSVHTAILKYWCENCKKTKCEKCVNVAYSQSCLDHSLTKLKDHVAARKREKTSIQTKNSSCFKAADQMLMKLQADLQKAELSALIQEDVIRQEFISFRALLIEEESNLLGNLRKSSKEYNVQNSKEQSSCGYIIAEEAELSCQNVKNQEYDLLSRVEDMDNTVKKWSVLEEKTKRVEIAKIPFPSTLQNKFTLFQEKTYIQKRLSPFLDPIGISPISFTVYLDGDTLESSLHVGDLFECKNSRYSFDDIEVDVEICQNRKVLQYLRLRINQSICNGNGTIRLVENSRYIVRARLVVHKVNSIKHDVGIDYRNVFIVTGTRSIQQKLDVLPQYINLNYINGIRQNYKTRCKDMSQLQSMNSTKSFHKWVDSNMWMFSSLGVCKGFFDVSPDEMRALAYCVDRQSYDLIEAQLNRDFQILIEHASQRHGFKGV